LTVRIEDGALSSAGLNSAQPAESSVRGVMVWPAFNFFPPSEGGCHAPFGPAADIATALVNNSLPRNNRFGEPERQPREYLPPTGRCGNWESAVRGPDMSPFVRCRPCRAPTSGPSNSSSAS
jgi:hypothetical protein